MLCCSILEHLPFDYFEKILKDIKDITNKRLILCLPYNGSYIANKTVFNLLGHKKRFKWCIHFKKILKKDYDIDKDGFHEHYWEVNVSKYSKKVIDNIIKKYFSIEEFIPNENPYHLFYILKLK